MACNMVFNWQHGILEYQLIASLPGARSFPCHLDMFNLHNLLAIY